MRCGAAVVMSRLMPFNYMAVSTLRDPDPCRALVEAKAEAPLDFLNKSMCGEKKKQSEHQTVGYCGLNVLSIFSLVGRQAASKALCFLLLQRGKEINFSRRCMRHKMLSYLTQLFT